MHYFCCFGWRTAILPLTLMRVVENFGDVSLEFSNVLIPRNWRCLSGVFRGIYFGNFCLYSLRNACVVCLHAIWLISKTNWGMVGLHNMHMFSGEKVNHHWLLLLIAQLVWRCKILGFMYIHILLRVEDGCHLLMHLCLSLPVGDMFHLLRHPRHQRYPSHQMHLRSRRQ